MRLLENASGALPEDELVLHLSEPHFTFYQRSIRRLRLFGYKIKDLLYR